MFEGVALATLSAPDADVAIRTSEPPRLHPLRRFGEIWASRELLTNLVRKEVKVKYKSSVLGAAWSMLNPILYLAVFSFVFTVVLKNNVPHFPVYLLSGILAWNLFATALTLGARSSVDNANLITKVYFPRELLPLASVGTALVDFVLQGIVLVAFMAFSRSVVAGWNLLLLPLAMLALIVFTGALNMWASALNVRYRDTQHLINLALLVWFWVTPIVYASALVFDRLDQHPVWKILYLANPMTDVVLGFQRALYGMVSPVVVVNGVPTPQPVLPDVSVAWLALLLTAVSAGCIALFLVAWRSFFHLSGDFAEEL